MKIDNGKAFDWGRVSDDYAKFRYIYPDEFYKKIANRNLCVNNQRVLDLGTGTVGIIAAKKAGRGVGVEINKSAVDDAVKNAAQNLCENIKFYCGDAGEFLEKSGEKFDVVFTDPPRAGCSKKFLNSLCKSGVKKIVYISCNPETLARDLRLMIKNGYSVDKLIPYDLFPQTSHVESLVRLSRRH